ncbi:hypothetical protein IMG5_177560 [Ichthyophthirius multifiliis]|uniref:Calmodulin n=1 Tax=Ichthyophthirius multifiliis TaxID=5932 RepID=G0R2F5_ICHMU|nr:hypothetical protein IMG5_177560 [Ichthyophthirius multifiliis]EGR28353.1 hypothetical protein IMG5_177560 [Ichthyophthirius multifiliis]|eukprot:XP_004027698.1 hypothetical protein IMG5_177560 [Ichthyophthirius multifiliis]
MNQNNRNNFDPREFVVPGVSEQEIEVYKQIFDFLDSHEQGLLTPKDIRIALKEIGGFNASRNLIYNIIGDFDSDSNGQIDFEEFVKMMAMKPCDRDNDDDILRIFDLLKIDHECNYLTAEDIKKQSVLLGEDATDNEIQQMMIKCDPEGKGKTISFDAFLKFNKKGQF